MAEFVQQHLEELLDVFTALRKTKYFTVSEVKSVIERVRQFDYSINKRTKRPKDFLKYAEYLEDVVELIHKRRIIRQSNKPKDNLEDPLRKHIAHLYRICADRFRKVEYFKKEIAFLRKTHQNRLCSMAYTRLLQFHGNDPKNHAEAGLWEFFDNKSAENARTIFQYAIRKFKQDVGLRVAFVQMEAGFLNVMHERRLMLAAMKDTTDEQNAILMSMEGVNDAVFEGKLIELVVSDALEALEENKGEFLLKAYLELRKYGSIVEKATEFVVEQFETVENVKEEKKIVEIIQDWPQEFNMLDAYLEAAKKVKTPRMYRLTAEVAKKEFESTADDRAKSVLIAQLEKLHKLGEAEQSDYDWLSANLDATDEATANVFSAMLENTPTNASMWEKVLSYHVNKHIDDAKSTDSEKVMALFDDALEKVHNDESLPIWRLLIDFTINKFPAAVVDAAFKRALLQTRDVVHAEIKEIRLNYIKTAYPNDMEKYEDEYKNLARTRPTSIHMHLDYAATVSDPEKKNQIFDNLVAEHGKSVTAWLEYGRALMVAQPNSLSRLYMRALSNLDPAEKDHFNEEWTLMIRSDPSLEA
uniref:Signal recognition particle subunit SRP68 n=1 Tax=Panagrellus redivivus TaxID=6233 RepID=A0A7E4V077_PANRE